MMFCPKCGSIVFPKKDDKGKNIIICSCGYKEGVSAEQSTITEEVTDKFEMEAIEKEHEVHPIVEAKCEKCENDQAYFWELQTRASDEPATKFYKCVKCKSVWRDYS